ncbi:cell wall metabolism sensor histidine kinase WalK [Microbacterium sp. cf332]|uniref:sensor histidine kinase n=1 Tax=Microbacterium sp. cf332 TaxID=1761804 RepID=UPI0008825ADA|nr:HAMP domain-containing sensor histidine kinase [Microbacterium sp. cf332]SDQ05899.1 Signal transduction histidine kinase [Microbacterium sp. cf332]
MNPSRSEARRARILGILLVVVCAGFVVVAIGALLVFLLLDADLPWPVIAVYALVAGGTLVTVWLVGWPLLATPPREAAAQDAFDAAVEAQRRLLDDVRHELKTPIAIVRGHLELVDSADPADVDAVRDIAVAELDRMTRLIGDIDLLASVEGERFAMDDVDVESLTQRVVDLVTVIPGHDWRVEASHRAIVHGDADRLLQAWLQLADNAAKHTPPGTAIELGSGVYAGALHLWVRDHGPGIPPAARHRIFRRFDRGGRRRSAGGSGLGLAIVDAIAKGHGGSCAVTETAGGGATFTITIPLRSARRLPSPVRADEVVLQRKEIG